MSYGSISAEAHETLAVAMNRLGGKSNTEGGRSRTVDARTQRRFQALSDQAGGFGALGVTIQYLTNADELQIKIIQGRSPEKGVSYPGQGRRDYCRRAPLHPRRGPHQPAAAPRYLFHRRHGAAYP